MNDHATPTTGATSTREVALAQEAPFDLAGTAVRPAALELEWDGQVTSLEPRVMQVLVALVRAKGRPVSRDELIDLCWGGRIVTEGALNRCVAQLRKALGEGSRVRIETIPKVGYRLQVGGEAPAAQSPLVVAARGNESNGGTARAELDVASLLVASERTVTPRMIRVAAAVMGALLIVLAVWFVLRPTPVRWVALSYRPITSTPAEESFPALSPDGEQIVYAVRPDPFSARDLYLRNVDQGTPVRITSDGEDDYGPAWSPSGDRIAFVRSRDDGPCAIVVVPVPLGAERTVARCEVVTQARPSWLDGQTLVIADQPTPTALPRVRAIDVETGMARDLTSPAPSTLGDADPQASPDGRFIVFRRTLTLGADDLFMLDVASGREQALTSDGYKAAGYVWSADSRHVFFSSNRGGEFNLWSVDREVRGPPRSVSLGLGAINFNRMSADQDNRLAVEVTRGRTNLARVLLSGESRPVTVGSGGDFDPASAADGAIVHTSNRSGAYEVWVTTAEGQSVRLTALADGYVARPCWSPDGQSIAFVAVKGRNADLYTVARDGSKLRQLTRDGIHKRDAAYSLRGDRLFYVERREGKWRLMQVALADASAKPIAVPGGERWHSLNAGPGGRLFGRRESENIIRVLDVENAAASGVRASDDRFRTLAENLRVTDIDNWIVGERGIYVRRGRLVHQPSSLWFYPWNEPGRKLADTPFAGGNIGVDANGNALISQAIDSDIDLALMQLSPGT
jgi:Tol biopolymer transport system component/DNA-binding winged helix-turn-helix (wHTH) protein